MAILVGSDVTTNYTDTGNSDYDTSAGKIYWLPYTAGTSGNVTTLGLYTQDMEWSDQQIKLLIADGSGNVLAATAAIAMNSSAAGWKTGSISSTAVTSSSTYRLGFMSNGSGDYTYVFGHSSTTSVDRDNTGNTFASDPPASTIVSDFTSSYAQFLMYGDGTAGGGSIVPQAMANYRMRAA
jgi:hypothetical protein